MAWACRRSTRPRSSPGAFPGRGCHTRPGRFGSRHNCHSARGGGDYYLNGLILRTDDAFQASTTQLEDQENGISYRISLQYGVDASDAWDTLSQYISEYRIAPLYDRFDAVYLDQEPPTPLNEASRYNIMSVYLTDGRAIRSQAHGLRAYATIVPGENAKAVIDARQQELAATGQVYEEGMDDEMYREDMDIDNLIFNYEAYHTHDDDNSER